MEVVNPEGLGVGLVPGRIGFPAHSMTVVVKSVWALEAGRLKTHLPEHPLQIPTGDLPAGEDDGEAGAPLRHANDLLPWKPRADLLLVGHCHPPGMQAVRQCPVHFQVGSTGLTLDVHGDRWWDGSGVRPVATRATPFHSMPLTWDRAWGGPGVPENPAGKGAGTIRLPDGGEAWPLPNVERADQPLRAPDQGPTPGSFGPIPVTWAPRAGAAGTYDDRWLRTRWPWFAEDLDPSFFSAAPPGLRAPGYLKGDEDLLLRNLVEGNPELESRLPGLRTRCFLHRLPEGHPPPPRRPADREGWSPPAEDRMQFVEVGLSLDTMWVDADEGIVALVWRGHAPVSGEDAREVLEVFVGTEPLSEPPASRDAWRTRFLELRAEEAEELEAPGDDPPGPEGAEAEAGGEVGADEDGPDSEEEIPPAGEDLFGGQAVLAGQLENRGLPPSAPPPELSPEELEDVMQGLRDAGQGEAAESLADLLAGTPEDDEDEEEPREPWTRERVQDAWSRDESLQGEDLSGLDLSGLELPEIDLRGTRLRKTLLADADLTGARLDEADLGGAVLDRATLDGAVLDGASLADASLREASLEGMVAREASASGADMTEVNLDDALLDGFRAPGARLDGATFRDAGLPGADLSSASLRKAVLDGAVLSGATLDEAILSDASLVGVEFDGARARKAIFHRAVMEGFRGAEALDLSESDFSQVRANGSIWSGARLRKALFPWAHLEEADFADADLEGADFWAAHLRSARFERTSLIDARLARADGFEMNFEEAELLRTDLRGGSFFAAEFLGARLTDALASGADLGDTKHG